MKRYRLTGMLDARGIEPDPEGRFVLWKDMAPLLTDPVTVALADYAARLEAWDVASHEGIHAFEDADLDVGLRAALRAARRQVGCS